VFWKTGTSFGPRDAWSAGWGPRHVAVVWLGNMDNAPSMHLVGSEAAGPILFDILEALGPRRGTVVEEVSPPADLAQVEVCAYSGYVPGEACPHRRQAWARRSHVPVEPCPYHRRVEVDVESGQAVGPLCRGERRTEWRTYVTWPASIRRWLAEQQRLLPQPPSLAPGCEPTGPERAPEIVSPAAGQVALLIPGLPPEQQEVPLEAEAEGHGELTWFVDGLYLGRARADERVWWQPSAGTHEIVVSDEQGRTDRRLLVVRERR
jgi:penicillin-binding protein 1C